MAKTRDSYVEVPEEKELGEVQNPSTSTDQDELLEERFDKEFWEKVHEKVLVPSISWNRAMDEVRVDRLVEKHDIKNVLFVIIDKWPRMEKYQDKPELLPSLEYLISRLTEIILERDENKQYKYFRVSPSLDPSRPTLLHLAAKQNFVHVCKSLVEKYPHLLYIWTSKHADTPSYLPVELALKKKKDDSAAYLISRMNYTRVHELFLCKDDVEQSPPKFYFGNIISYRNAKTKEPAMKKTVIAVLDKLINPHYPYLPERRGGEHKDEDDEIERSLSNVPDDPMNYDFFYHILEADEDGRQPKVEKVTDTGNKTTKENDVFNQKSISCLRRIAESGNKEAVQHPVVRMLVSRKWNSFAHKWFSIQATFYVLFLFVLSFALIYGSTRDDPTQYNGKLDDLRLFCEICSIIFIMVYLIAGIIEACGEGLKSYLDDRFNAVYYLFCYLGLVLVFLVLPLRFAEIKSQWTVAGLGYVLIFLRLFKYSCVTRTSGLYTKTLAKIIYRDIGRFMMVFVIIFIGFCGALFMVLKATDSQGLFSNFSWLMLAAVRALTEQQPVDEDYSKFSWLAILILLAYMAMVIVILLNILIAQLSYTYTEAKKTAKLQYAVDTMRIVSRLEYSRIPFWNFRVKKYIHGGDWISEEDLAEEILEYTEERHPWETVEERLTNVREIMRKVVRKRQ